MLVLAITNTAKVSAVRIDSVTLRTLLFVQAGAFLRRSLLRDRIL